MTDAMTAAEVGVAKLSAATAAPVTDDEKEKRLYATNWGERARIVVAG
jgi:hypothetical protein